MKTTVDIPQSLLDEAKKLAANHRTTVKALVEEGLRHVISEHQRSGGVPPP
jgi:mRNA-degrading endonuclease RelE of RelBE toxin-antitoxin system